MLSDNDALHLVLVNNDVERTGRQVNVHVEVKRLDGTQVDATDLNAAIDDSGIVKCGPIQSHHPHSDHRTILPDSPCPAGQNRVGRQNKPRIRYLREQGICPIASALRASCRGRGAWCATRYL